MLERHIIAECGQNPQLARRRMEHHVLISYRPEIVDMRSGICDAVDDRDQAILPPRDVFSLAQILRSNLMNRRALHRQKP